MDRTKTEDLPRTVNYLCNSLQLLLRQGQSCCSFITRLFLVRRFQNLPSPSPPRRPLLFELRMGNSRRLGKWMMHDQGPEVDIIYAGGATTVATQPLLRWFPMKIGRELSFGASCNPFRRPRFHGPIPSQLFSSLKSGSASAKRGSGRVLGSSLSRLSAETHRKKLRSLTCSRAYQENMCPMNLKTRRAAVDNDKPQRLHVNRFSLERTVAGDFTQSRLFPPKLSCQRRNLLTHVQTYVGLQLFASSEA